MNSARARMRLLRNSTQRVAWYWWAAGYFSLMTIAMTWPLVLRMGNSVVGSYGDSLNYIWLIGWFKKSIFELRQSPLFSYMINYPEGWRLAGDDFSPLMVLTGLPLGAVLGPVFGYNVSALLSFASSGFIVCWWTQRMTGKLLPGLLAGTLFAFSSYRVSHFIAGHLNLLGTQWIALYFLSLYETLELSPKSRAWSALAGVSLGLVALTSQYYMYMTLVLTALFIPIHALTRGPAFVLRQAYIARVFLVLVIAVPLLALAEYPYFEAASTGRLPSRGVGEAIRDSASPADYVIPPNGHPLLGDWVDGHFDRSLWIETTLYLGIAATAAALTALAASVPKPGGRSVKLHVGLMAACAFLLSLGPQFRWFSGQPRFQLPGALAWMVSGSSTPIRLPGSLLYQYLPYYDSLRVPARYGLYVILFCCVLAGLGLAHLMRRPFGATRMVGVGALVAVMIFETLPWGPSFSLVRGRPVDYWLAAQPGPGAVVQLPPSDKESEALAYYTLIHGRPTVSGHDNLRTPVHAQIKAALRHTPDQEGIDMLQSLGVRYLVVDLEWYAMNRDLQDLERELESLGVEKAAAFEDFDVYEIEP